MQRRSTLLLLKRAINLAPKRPMEGFGVGSAAATAPATPAAARPPLPRQAPTATAPTTAGTTAAAATPQAPVRPASLVTPPAGGAPITGSGSGMRKKKIIRRIVKRKRTSGGAVVHTAASTTAAAAAAATPLRASAGEMTAAAATVASRATAMLNEIRKQPEGVLTEEENPQHYDDTATAADATEEEYTPVQDDTAEFHHAVQPKEDAEDDLSTAAGAGEANESTAEHYAADMQALHDETDELAGTTTTSSRKTAMVKGYRIDEVSNLCSPNDAIFARRMPSGGCQFFAWPGTPLPVASKAILSMPDTIRTVHAVFGRPGTPMDIVMDIDCQVPQEYWTMTKIRPFQLKVLDDVLSSLQEEIEKMGESIETQVVLQSPNLKKASFHVHTKLKDAAFADFNSLHGFLSKFQERLPNVDMQIYRPHGMLRMFSCMKENHTSAIVVFDDPKWNLGFPGGKVSDAQAALHSVCVRDPATFTRTLTFASPRMYFGATGGKADDGGADGEGSRRLPPQVRLPLTEKEAVANASRWLRMANEVEVGEWRSWIGLGLCAFRIAHHFRNAKGLPRPAMEEMLAAWTEASRKCPLKYHQGECETRWSAFSPDKLGERSDWWGAYKRIGRLEGPVMEAEQKEAAEAAERARRVPRRAAAPSNAEVSTPAASPQPASGAASAAAAASGPKENVASASRKLKLKKRTIRSAQ
ncbi:putative mitochondrial mitochondrial DNA primase, putative (PRI1) [Leptomonas pyrrhocoris]|uniref:Putative mitochondrial mitochondrial DNA primase, putative (PRI1) n=1 Tax=Leptomonas pyrrhocoris TaxID=157538 RepID=A0A0N0VGN1_LEPPY|nr:putative mitochondrial mitochondrial DNA primase, putative (PRI1) [Leptomonas pyrrhocoris]XP_015662442.1 putative mitochondrial mitochondrial DNA primase, putative (PRI1) [Leptomonas pyrrhocoris]XP_015662443.1 putative mitochondrial mitochondrial DNA primase, putative (PRI1) [Leptomonas pyrrhocoris]KPA84002.1 putative mitochondrial mitochondrial DNA primase, putative (PRI1) [Leptomonas pyrrhocoris]KPA84003.1 putative mitochondrial mitochondrial DNA primase, putative (PRI1) [Leptomonas pyrrho|eukprot:XP_015662441.1 putative mitochondrial mitochondrial DNA primase, putative (PRI1) [Leptomonas pyrrhocoris]